MSATMRTVFGMSSLAAAGSTATACHTGQLMSGGQRAIQDWLRSPLNTATIRYTELAPSSFKHFWVSARRMAPASNQRPRHRFRTANAADISRRAGDDFISILDVIG